MAPGFTIPQAYDPQMHREDQVSLSRTTTMQSTRPKARQSTTASTFNMLSPAASKDGVGNHQRRHFVFADPVAFRYLEEDPATVVVERRGRLRGYELYLVEQWALSRVHPTFVITTYTGNPDHSVLVGVLGIPVDEDEWSPRLRVYFKAISQYRAKPKETPLGMLMVTNLGNFPSNFTVIPVPDGDVRKHREDFIVNGNLKRQGCSGRSGLSISSPPAGATQAKFHQLYKTSDRIPFYGAVLELVKLCQVALMVFGKLDAEYADGMLCDVTERAINDWWTEIGSEYYNIKPTDGILGPTTVSALLGLLMGARNRLNYYGAPVAKDAFDIACLKRGIAYFQKSQKLDRTRRLDRHTLNRLHNVTAKAAAGEGWGLPKAVKSTVTELSGKGGEMMMGIVGRDKAGIGDIETLDIDRFVSLVHGERSKWLWFGKPRRTTTSDNVGNLEPESGTLAFKKDEQGGYIWATNRSDTVPVEDDAEMPKQENHDGVYRYLPPGSSTSIQESTNDKELRKAVFKSVTGKMSDARSGFGRIKDAVGLRNHASRPSKDDTSEFFGRNGTYLSPTSTTTFGLSMPPSPQLVGKASSWKSKLEENSSSNKLREILSNPLRSSQDGRNESESPKDDSRNSLMQYNSAADRFPNAEAEAEWATPVQDVRQELVDEDPSVCGSGCGNGDLEGPMLEAERTVHNFRVLLHRRHSIATENQHLAKPRNEAWWPRQMSFSDAEDAVLGWTDLAASNDDRADADNWTQMQKQMYLAEISKHLYEKISVLMEEMSPWVTSKVDSIEAINDQAAQDHQRFQNYFYERSSIYQTIKQHSQEVLEDERSHVTEAIKDIEVLGSRLEYEINALVSKVHDVEDGVSQFERRVEDLEARYKELEDQFNNEGWAHWLIRSITGIGTAPRR